MTAHDNAREGLPGHLFRYVSSVTPLVNVDLLVSHADKGVLLTWREDDLYGPGWHIPGGIIRFKESALERVEKVAGHELDCSSLSDVTLISVFQIMHPTRDVRGHFISFLYRARALHMREHPAAHAGSGPRRNGDAAWHTVLPRDMIPQHERYGPIIEAALSGQPFDGRLQGNLCDPIKADRP